MKRILSSLLSLILILLMIPPIPAAAKATTMTQPEEAADALHVLGLFNGTGIDKNGNPIFSLDKVPTRHEGITMLVNLMGMSDYAKQTAWETPFVDVANWAQPFVGFAYDRGLTTGVAANLFGGNTPINAAQYLTFVLRALNYEDGVDFEWQTPWTLTDRLNITDGRYPGNGSFTRSDVASISLGALFAPRKGTGELMCDALIRDGVFTREKLNYAMGVDRPKVMDLKAFAGEQLEFGEVTESNYPHILTLPFVGGNRAAEVMSEYMDLLCREYDFKAVPDPYKKIDGDYIWAEYALLYQGSEPLPDYKDKTLILLQKGHISIFVQSTREGDIVGELKYNEYIRWVDFGLRCNIADHPWKPVGASFDAGLRRLEDGSFQTTDGRLQTTVGHAHVLRDGQSYTGNVHYADMERKLTQIKVDGYCGSENVSILLPQLDQGENTVHRDLAFMVDTNYAVIDGGKSKTMPDHGTRYQFATYHNGWYHYPIPDMSGDLKAVSLKILYKSTDIAVYHIGMAFGSAPYEVEILAAASRKSPSGGGSNVGGGSGGSSSGVKEEYDLGIGNSITISGPSQFGSSYNIWKWEAVTNGNAVRLSNTKSRNVTVTGVQAGDVRIRVTYDYTVTEPDVLTDIPRDVSRSKRWEFIVHVQ